MGGKQGKVVVRVGEDVKENFALFISCLDEYVYIYSDVVLSLRQILFMLFSPQLRFCQKSADDLESLATYLRFVKPWCVSRATSLSRCVTPARAKKVARRLSEEMSSGLPRLGWKTNTLRIVASA